MIQRSRELLAVILIGLLPFHALLVTVGTKYLRGSGNAPMTELVLWKEGLLVLILIVAFVEWFKSHRKTVKFDEIDVLIVWLIALSLIVTAYTHSDWKLYLFGFKYDFIPLVAFLCLRRVPWSDAFIKWAFRVIIGVGVLVAGYAIAAMFLPQAWFMLLGYSDLHSLYLLDAPLAAYQQLEALGIRRAQSVMSGPNQLGLWLLIPFGIVTIRMLRGRVTSLWSLVTGLIGIAILLTFSRSAWIAAFVIFVLVLHKAKSKEVFKKSMMGIGGLIIVSVIVLTMVQPGVLLRVSSTRDHLLRPVQALDVMTSNRYGLGMGIAGPASNRVSDTCVYLEEGSDVGWARNHLDLCVFVGGTQVQPRGSECRCPFLPENWYLQIGLEMGVIGFILYLIMIFYVLHDLYKDEKFRPLFLAFLGISIAALFLHAWEDSAVAYSMWVLVAAACTT